MRPLASECLWAWRSRTVSVWLTPGLSLCSQFLIVTLNGANEAGMTNCIKTSLYAGTQLICETLKCIWCQEELTCNEYHLAGSSLEMMYFATCCALQGRETAAHLNRVWTLWCALLAPNAYDVREKEKSVGFCRHYWVCDFDVVSDCWYKLDVFFFRGILHIQCLINFSVQTLSKAVS